MRDRDSHSRISIWRSCEMFSWLANAWRVPELRSRVLFTALILAAYRLGSWMPAPGVDSQTIQDYFSGRGGTVLGLLNLFSGGALSQFSLFALGIMPYVTASIILQLMTVVIPRLGELQKEGEAGLREDHAVHALPHRRRSRRRRRPATPSSSAPGRARRRLGRAGPHHRLRSPPGTVLLMWMGELITKRGIGNGISILIFASILVGAPLGDRAPGATAARWRSSSSRSSRSGSSRRSSSSRRASAGSRSSTRSAWSGGG